MPKEHKATKATQAIGKIDSLINKLTKEKEERDWLVKKITSDGPPHKQWQHTLVLSRLQTLVALKEKQSGVKFAPLTGNNIIVETPHHNLELPIGFPESFKKMEKELSKGPEHEVAYTAILLQTIEWLLTVEIK